MIKQLNKCCGHSVRDTKRVRAESARRYLRRLAARIELVIMSKHKVFSC